MIAVALMRKPSKYTFYHEEPQMSGLWGLLNQEVRVAIRQYNIGQKLWWDLLDPFCTPLLRGRGVYLSVSDRLRTVIASAPRPVAYGLVCFLNEHYKTWREDVTICGEDEASDYVGTEGRCSNCDYTDDCDERCEDYWEDVQEYQDEHTDWNMGWLQERWRLWREAGVERTPPETTLLTPETIGIFEPVVYMRRDFTFDQPCEVEGTPTRAQLSWVANRGYDFPTTHLMNLWCRMRIALPEVYDKEVDSARNKPQVWGTRAAATAVLALDRHQKYMEDNGVGWEVNYGHPAAG